jgi:hypothetical protein
LIIHPNILPPTIGLTSNPENLVCLEALRALIPNTMALYEGVYLYFLDALMFPILNPLSVPNGNVGTKGTANPQPVEDELEELLEDEDG